MGIGVQASRPFIQSGVALLASLLLLSTLSLLAITAASGMVQQQRMSANFIDHQHSFRASRFALQHGERFLYRLASDLRMVNCLDACYPEPLSSFIHQKGQKSSNPEQETSDWWLNWGIEAGLEPEAYVVTASEWPFDSPSPRFFIEEVYFKNAETLSAPEEAPGLNGIAYYRIMSRGNGLGSDSVSIGEAIIARPWPVDEPEPEVQVHSELTEGSFCAPYTDWYDCGKMSWRRLR